MEQNKITLQVKHLSNKISIDIDPNSKVEDIKKDLEQRFNIPISEQKLMCKGKNQQLAFFEDSQGKVLKDEDLFSSYNIETESVAYLVSLYSISINFRFEVGLKVIAAKLVNQENLKQTPRLWNLNTNVLEMFVGLLDTLKKKPKRQ